jgi:hypothetical protein
MILILLYRLCCIAPVLAANVLKGCEVTVGSDKEEGGRWPYAGTAGAIQAMGSSHVCKDVSVSFNELLYMYLNSLWQNFHRRSIFEKTQLFRLFLIHGYDCTKSLILAQHSDI